jgi:hypothetical protein
LNFSQISFAAKKKVEALVQLRKDLKNAFGAEIKYAKGKGDETIQKEKEALKKILKDRIAMRLLISCMWFEDLQLGGVLILKLW